MANNPAIFDAVIAGVAGGNFTRWIQSTVQADYSDEANIADAVATQVDAGIPAGSPTESEVNLMNQLTAAVMTDRQPASITPSSYAAIANSIIAAFNQIKTKLQATVPASSSKYNVLVTTPADLATKGGATGDLAFVSSRQGIWMFNAVAGLVTPEPNTVVNGVGGQWFFLWIGSPVFQAQTQWEVDATTGSNDNSGLPGSPVASISEIARRWGPYARLGGADYSINVLSDAEGTLPLQGVMTTDHWVVVQGVPLPALYTGSFTAAYVAPAKATQQRSQITDAAMPDYTAFGYQRVRMTSGAQANATAMIIKRTAATVAFTTSFLNLNTTAAPVLSPAIVSPANGDAYVLDRLPIITNFAISIQKPTGTRPAFIVDSLEFSSATIPNFESVLTTLGYVYRSIFRGGSYVARNTRFQGCEWVTLSQGRILDDFVLYGCGLIGAQTPPVTRLSRFEGLTIFQGGANNAGGIAVPGTDSPALLIVEKNIGVLSSVSGLNGGFGIFDSRVAGLLLRPSASMATLIDGVVYGTGNTTHGIIARPGAIFSYDAATCKPTVTGTGGDTEINGATVPYANIPAFDAQSGAGIVGV